MEQCYHEYGTFGYEWTFFFFFLSSRIGGIGTESNRTSRFGSTSFIWIDYGTVYRESIDFGTILGTTLKTNSEFDFFITSQFFVVLHKYAQDI